MNQGRRVNLRVVGRESQLAAGPNHLLERVPCSKRVGGWESKNFTRLEFSPLASTGKRKSSRSLPARSGASLQSPEV